MMAELIGRFHPLIIHLPIGILIAAFITELASRKASLSHLKSAVPFVLLLAILTSVLAFFTGWIMPKEGEFDEGLISLHLWFSVGMTVCTILVYLSRISKNDKLKKLYFPMFLVSMILLIITGHYGGSLTHGAGHLTQSLKKKEKKQVTNVNALLAYQDVIAPILEQKCTGCHNEEKQKGGLQLASIEGLKKGGDSGFLLFADSLKESLLLQRIHLPMEDEEHMPPEGKRQLTVNEIALLEWWITAGADFETKVGQIPQNESQRNILLSYEQNSNIDTEGLDVLSDKEINDFAGYGIQVTPHHEESPLLMVSFLRDTTLSKKDLKRLKKIGNNITELDLSFSNMNDELMPQLSKLKNLQKLKLQKTQVSSKGLKHLENLEHLNYLNVYGTELTDAAFESLDKLSNLKSLFLWQTKVTKEGFSSYTKNHPAVNVSYQIENELFSNTKLTSPVIKVDKTIFVDTISVKLDLNFKNVEIFYTLDGKEPDSTSLKYDSVFVINKTSNIKAISLKEGWTNSKISEKVIRKVGHKVVKASLAQPPNEKYKAEGAKSLIDFEKGSTSFTDGKWLGYEGQHMTATLDLGKSKEINNIVIGSLEDTGSYIFYPKSITVSTSLEGRSFAKQKGIKIPMAKANAPPQLKSFTIELEPLPARYVKVDIKSTLKNPDWHAAPGAKNWIFIDEILID